jgi:hypothetical protein
LKKFKRQGAIEKQPKFNATKKQIRRFLASYFSIRQISRPLGPVLKKAGKDSSHYRLSEPNKNKNFDLRIQAQRAKRPTTTSTNQKSHILKLQEVFLLVDCLAGKLKGTFESKMQ